MLLYHFSNYDFKILKPSFFGHNHYSQNEKKACVIARSFCYDSKEPLEHLLKGLKYRYTLQIEKHLIYDLDRDIFKLKEKHYGNIDTILLNLKSSYQGISYTTSFKCYCLFEDQKVLRQDVLY